MTLETEEGKCRADNYNDTVSLPEFEEYRLFLGHEIDVKESPEPNDIIWENRSITQIERNFRTFIVIVIVVAMLALSFVCIYFAQKRSLELKLKYPKTNCKDYEREYYERLEAWKGDSIHEFMINSEIEEKGGMPLYTGPFQCFCKHQKQTEHSKNANYELRNADGKVVFSEPICQIYQGDLFKSKLLGLSITLIIIFINMMLRKAILALVKWIGEDTDS